MTRHTSAFAWIAAAILVSSLFSVASPAVAAGPTFTVDSALDQIDDDVATPGTCHTAANTCTLRAAIMEANRSDVDVTIVVPAGLFLLTIAPSGSDGETNGDLNLTTPASGDPVITIVGAGAGSTIIDANQLDGVLSVAEHRSASIGGVTIRNGSAPFDGGGIYNSGTLTLSNATISDNHAVFNGGGIYDRHILDVVDSRISHNDVEVGSGGGIISSGELHVRNSTISANLAGQFGGGIYTTMELTLRNSTISDNQANLDAGGIYSASDLIVSNSTISQNDAIRNAGGLLNLATGNLYNTTIAFNHANALGSSPSAVGGGVVNTATLNLRNSLLAANFKGSTTFGSFDDCSGTLTGYGENLVYAALVSSNCALAGSWDFLNDPGTLGPLQDNGGPTWTQALLPGSNAIDGTSGSGCVDEASIPLVTDQRGAPRVTGLACDVGAFEVPEPDALIASAAALATVGSMRRARRGARADHA